LSNPREELDLEESVEAAAEAEEVVVEEEEVEAEEGKAVPLTNASAVVEEAIGQETVPTQVHHCGVVV